MLSFEEKKAIFHSFKLKEKKISNGRVSFVYPESIQKGQVLATQLHPSGNGYVIGKYMSEDVIKKNGYQVDPRGWISIKVFSKEEIAEVITAAMKSMAGESVEGLPKTDIPNETKKDLIENMGSGKKIESSRDIRKAQPSTYEIYPASYLFAWTGLALSTMEFGFLAWRNTVRRLLGSKN